VHAPLPNTVCPPEPDGALTAGEFTLPETWISGRVACITHAPVGEQLETQQAQDPLTCRLHGGF
jgi:hypothetical protein